MAEHPPVRTLLATSTLALIGAHERIDEADDHSHWMIERPKWAMALHAAVYALAVVRMSNDLCTVVIGHQTLQGAVHCDAERNGVSDLDVDAVVLDLWHQGSGQPVEVRHANR